MKKQQGHIFYLSIISLVLIVAGVLAINGFSTFENDGIADTRTNLVLDELSVHSVLDTLKLMDDPCYEYKSLEQNCSGETESDIIVKTVVKVEQEDGRFKELQESSIKTLPPNASINLMIEKYQIERLKKPGSTSFFVTVESFSTILEKFNRPEFIAPQSLDKHTSLTEEQLELLHTNYATNLVLNKCREQETPM